MTMPGTTSNAPPLAAAIHAVTAWLTEDFLGGPRLWKFAWVIDFQKGGTIFFLGLLIWWYGNTSAAAWVYLAMHGGYGIVWFVKDMTFPDRRWQKRITVGGAVNAFLLALGWYWLLGWLLISHRTPDYPLPEPMWFSLCIGMCILGTSLMVAADAQKYFTLRAKPGLITDGMFKVVRHPNYLGEMMIYASFALMVWRWLPVAVLAAIWLFEFAVNMVLIEASLARYPEWPAYRRRTSWLVPYVL